jgi:GntR family transcriptional regulator
VRELRYLAIAADLRQQVESGAIPAGRLLPSEAELSRAYEASRVTVRKALALLRAEGVVDSRQGFGWFAAIDPLPQELGRLATIESQLSASGMRPERRVLDFRFVSPPKRVATYLGEGTVLEVRRLNLADGIPFARVTVWVPERTGAALSRDDVEARPFYELLDVPLEGATQTIAAALVDADDAAILGVPEGSAVLCCERVTYGAHQQAVLVSEHVFPAHRTKFVVQLLSPEASIAPAGLHLVEGALGGAVERVGDSPQPAPN